MVLHRDVDERAPRAAVGVRHGQQLPDELGRRRVEHGLGRQPFGLFAVPSLSEPVGVMGLKVRVGDDPADGVGLMVEVHHAGRH